MEVSFTTQSAGRANLVTGSFTTDGTSVDVRIGFMARHIRLIDTSDDEVWEWIEAMPEDVTFHTAGGAPATDSTGAISVYEKHFTISAAVADNGKDFVFVAM